ncbi:hypothetical protein DFJ77DRAFT_516330 [Powellomyces hirtus]|nr:hypothetical protein DFJ77DRAFT_516330 [Powellomyces hirtus]
MERLRHLINRISELRLQGQQVEGTELCEATELVNVFLDANAGFLHPQVFREGLAGLTFLCKNIEFGTVKNKLEHDVEADHKEILPQGKGPIIRLLELLRVKPDAASSTSISFTCRILKCLNSCLDNPHIMEWVLALSENQIINSTSLQELALPQQQNITPFELYIQPMLRVDQKLQILRLLDSTTRKVAMYRACAKIQDTVAGLLQIEDLDKLEDDIDRCTRSLLLLASAEVLSVNADPDACKESTIISREILNLEYLTALKTMECIGTLLGSVESLPITAVTQMAILASVAKFSSTMLHRVETVNWLFPPGIGNGKSVVAPAQPVAWLYEWCSTFGIDLGRYLSLIGLPTDWPHEAMGIFDILSFNDKEIIRLCFTAKEIVCMMAQHFKATLTVRKLKVMLDRTDHRSQSLQGPRQLLHTLRTMLGSNVGQQAVASALEIDDGILPLVQYCLPTLGSSSSDSLPQKLVHLASETLDTVWRSNINLSIPKATLDEYSSGMDDTKLLGDLLPSADLVIMYETHGVSGIVPILSRQRREKLRDVSQISQLLVSIRVLIKACDQDNKFGDIISYVDDQELVTSRGTLAEASVLTVLLELLGDCSDELASMDDKYLPDQVLDPNEEKPSLGQQVVEDKLDAIRMKHSLLQLLLLGMTLLRKIVSGYDASLYPQRAAYAKLPPVLHVSSTGFTPTLLDPEDASQRQQASCSWGRPSSPLFAVPAILIRILHTVEGGCGGAGYEKLTRRGRLLQPLARDVTQTLRDFATAVVLHSKANDEFPGQVLIADQGKRNGNSGGQPWVLAPKLMLPLGAFVRAVLDTILHEDPQMLVTGINALHDLLPSDKEMLLVSSKESMFIEETDGCALTGSRETDRWLVCRYWQEGLCSLRNELSKILRLVASTSSVLLYESAVSFYSRLLEMDGYGHASPDDRQDTELAHSIVGVLLDEIRRTCKSDKSTGSSGGETLKFEEARLGHPVPESDQSAVAETGIKVEGDTSEKVNVSSDYAGLANNATRISQKLHLLQAVTRSEGGTRTLHELNAERGRVSDLLLDVLGNFGDYEDVSGVCRPLLATLMTSLPLDCPPRLAATRYEFQYQTQTNGHMQMDISQAAYTDNTPDSSVMDGLQGLHPMQLAKDTGLHTEAASTDDQNMHTIHKNGSDDLPASGANDTSKRRRVESKGSREIGKALFA